MRSHVQPWFRDPLPPRVVIDTERRPGETTRDYCIRCHVPRCVMHIAGEEPILVYYDDNEASKTPSD